MQPYLDLLEYVTENGYPKPDRTGTGVVSKAGVLQRYDLRGNTVIAPTTKKHAFKPGLVEEEWMLSGQTTVDFLKANNCNIWDEWVFPDTATYRTRTVKEMQRQYSRDHFGWGKPGLKPSVSEPGAVFTYIHQGNEFDIQECQQNGMSRHVVIDRSPRGVNKGAWYNPEDPIWISFYSALGISDQEVVTGHLGAVYGKMFRDIEDTRIIKDVKADQHLDLRKRGFTFEGHLGGERAVYTRRIDQVATLLDLLATNPDDRRLILCPWNPAYIDEQALPPCFTRTALVETNVGYQRIGDINIGDMVKSAEGNLKRVNQVWRTPYVGKMLTIRPALCGIPMDCTPNHPFLVYGKGWVEAKDITLNDFLAIRKTKSFYDHTHKYTLNVGRGKLVDKQVECSLDDYYTFGYFLGNGWASHTQDRVSFAIPHKKVATILPRIRQTINVSIKPGPNISVATYETKSKKWNSLFREFGHLAPNKVIPQWLLDSTIEAKQMFLKGFLDADGHIKKDGGINVCVTSPHIVLSLQRLYAELGHVGRVAFQKKQPTTVIEGRTVNQNDVYHFALRFGNKVTNIKEDDDNVWVPVRQITEYDFDGMVYNLDVDDDHTYTVNNILNHNCHSFIQFWTRELSLDERVQLLGKRETDEEESLLLEGIVLHGRPPVKSVEQFRDYIKAWSKNPVTDLVLHEILDRQDIQKRAITCMLTQR